VQPVARVLAHHPRAPYDVVFLDPPYPVENDEVERAVALLVAHDWLAAGCVLAVERSARSVEPTWPAGLVRDREKTYGETVLWYVRADPAGSGSESAEHPTGRPETAPQQTTEESQTTSQGDPR
jgi:16S rRNA (guanine966-N2)-methyltransferase